MYTLIIIYMLKVSAGQTLAFNVGLFDSIEDCLAKAEVVTVTSTHYGWSNKPTVKDYSEYLQAVYCAPIKTSK